MALEAVVFPQDSLGTPSFNYPTSTSINNFGMSYEFANYYYSSKLEDTLKVPFNVGLLEVNQNLNTSNVYDFSPTSELLNIENNNISQWNNHQHHPQPQPNQQYVPQNYSSPEDNLYLSGEAPPPSNVADPTVVGGGARRKRRRRSSKNKEEVEHQRMTHIAVERNRRKQMNEYLAVIRSLMPPSYVQRGDQASIVGGAINYVKELEQLLQSMEAQNKSSKQQLSHNHHQQPPTSQPDEGGSKNVGSEELNGSKTEAWPALFSDFFSFPQYSTRSKANSAGSGGGNSVSSSNSSVGDIEVTMVESHANVKILAKKQPKQLVKLIAAFQGLRLNVLHLNVTTLDSFVLYSLSLKVEEGCQLNSVDDIAAAANHILGQIQEEAADHLL